MTRAEALAAASAAPSERAGVSITTKSTPLARAVSKVMGSRLACASITTGVSASRRSFQLHAVA